TGFFLAGFLLLIAFFNCFFHMAIYDKLYLSGSFYRETFQFFWGKQGILIKLTIPFLRYLSPSFHPNNAKEYTSPEQRAQRMLLIQKALSE
ncbi:MAG: hypothetical protein AB7V32_10455, partial [Candidatus Berkiella sp.]